MKDFLKRFELGFSCPFLTVFSLLILFSTPFLINIIPIEFTYENSYIENFQLVILLITFITCLKAKTDKKFFICLSLVCIILFLREINCGRTIFFPVEGQVNTFYSWKEIPYGWLAHPLYGAFMALSGLYFILTKSYKVLWNYFLHAKLSLINWICLFIGIIFGTVGEKIDVPALEELMEALFYISFFALIFLQSRNEKYIKQTEEFYKQ